MSKIVNRRDFDFLLYEFLDLEALCRSPRYDTYDRVAVEEILNAAQAIAEGKFYYFAAKLDATGHIVIAWMWLKQALAVPCKISGTHSDPAFYSGKHVATRFFFRYELPKVFLNLKIVASLDDTTLNITPAEFIG